MTDVIHVYNHPPKTKKEADHPSKFDRWYEAGRKAHNKDGNIRLNQSEARNRGFEKDKAEKDAVAVPARAQFQSLVRSHIAAAEQEYAQAQATLKQLPDSSWLRQKVVEARHKLERLKESGDAVMKDCESYDETKDGPIANWLAAHGFAFAGNHSDHAKDVSDSAVTIFQARDVLQRRGMIIYKKNEAFAVNFKDGHTTTVYQANNLEDAALTGLSMAKHKLGARIFKGKTKDDFFLDRFGSKIIWSQEGQDRLNALLAPMRKAAGKTVKDVLTRNYHVWFGTNTNRWVAYVGTRKLGDYDTLPEAIAAAKADAKKDGVTATIVRDGDSLPPAGYRKLEDYRGTAIFVSGNGKQYVAIAPSGNESSPERSLADMKKHIDQWHMDRLGLDKQKDAHTGPTRMQIQEFYTNAERSGGSKAVARAKTEKAFDLYDLKIDNKGQVIGYAFKQEGLREDHAKDVAKARDDQTVETYKGLSIVKLDKPAVAGAYRVEKGGIVFGYYPSPAAAKEAAEKYHLPKTPRKSLR